MTTSNIQNIDSPAGGKQERVARPPIVVVLGHVDHGKSSLLEAIREDFKITAAEAGGITQHIAVYQVEYRGKEITFIDTPGHQAFPQMRSRGAKVADIALLVVAADEGVKEQTKEAISQIQKANLPMIVVLNKIDNPGANVEKVKQELSQREVFVESLGGKVPSVETSAVTKQGISDLLDLVLLVAEVEDLKMDLDIPGEGVIIESFVNTQRGATVTLLVTNGRVRVGDIVATKSSVGRLRILEDFQGNSIEEVVPSMSAIAVGFEKGVMVGEEFHVFADESSARAQIVSEQNQKKQIADGEKTKLLTIIVKTDVQGSLEAVENMLSSLPKGEIALRVAKAEAGAIGENDVKLAQGIGARILGFRTKVDPTAASLADREQIPIETFDVIYELGERVKDLLEKSQESEIVRRDLGSLQVLEIFLTEKTRQIVGGKVAQGEVRKGSDVEIVREGEVIGRGKATSLKRGQTEADVVKEGEECGISYEGSGKIQEGDTLGFSIKELQQPSS